jgi:hypothetical protein
MSLDTVLKIGKALRNSENNLKYFKYVERCPQDSKTKEWPICITIPVKADFSFDWESVKLITSEIEREELYYLKFKTSDNDSSAKKYLFGDIYYVRQTGVNFDNKNIIKGVKDFGSYTLEKGNAFENGLKPYNEIVEKCACSLIEGIPEEKQKQKKAKEIISNYKKQINKKPAKSLFEEDNLVGKFKEFISNNNLIRFHSAFEQNLQKFEILLRYAPALESILIDEKENFTTYLTDFDKLKEKYIQIVYQNINDKTKRQLFGKIEKDVLSREFLSSLNDETKQKIIQYADFRVFIHFEFQNSAHWYQIKDAFDLLIDKLNSEITRKTEYGLVPDAYIYRTLCSGNNKNDIQFPNFEIDRAYKSFAFKSDEFDDFLYIGNILNKPFRRLYKTNIDMFIFPITIQGKNITATQYNTFFEKKNEDLLQSNEDPLLFLIQNEEPKNFNKFDFVLSDSSGNTTNDLIEISGIEQSDLKSISKYITETASKIRIERKDAIQYDKILKIENSFLNVLGTYQINKSGYLEPNENNRYKSHILKVLPLIYMKNYHDDALLLPAFIENIEKIVRMVKDNVSGYKYEQLKYDLKFLLSIQKKNMDNTKESKSYQIGLGLGKLSKPLKKKINSFEKRYVGLLTRRVSTKDECIEFSNEINQMLVRHEKTWGQKAAETIAKLVEIPQNEYDKEKLALGFFEGYFHYEVSDDKSKLISQIEKIISDYEGKDNFQNEIEVLTNALEDIK